MSDVMKTAKARRARLTKEIEVRMHEIERLESFIKMGEELVKARETKADVKLAS